VGSTTAERRTWGAQPWGCHARPAFLTSPTYAGVCTSTERPGSPRGWRVCPWADRGSHGAWHFGGWAPARVLRPPARSSRPRGATHEPAADAGGAPTCVCRYSRRIGPNGVRRLRPAPGRRIGAVSGAAAAPAPCRIARMPARLVGRDTTRGPGHGADAAAVVCQRYRRRLAPPSQLVPHRTEGLERGGAGRMRYQTSIITPPCCIRSFISGR
jgi:hypothetical protein